MKYLTYIKEGGGTENYEVKPGQHERIQNVLKSGNPPATFILQGKTLETKRILGFTNDLPKAKNTEKVEQIKKDIRQSVWYKRGKNLSPQVS